MPSRLNNWKEVAEYLRCSEKTARRWELSRGLPVHRVPGGAKGSIFAFPGELDAWLAAPAARESELPSIPVEQLPAAPARGSSRLGLKILLLASTSVAAILLFLYSQYQPAPRLTGNPVRLVRSTAAKLPPLLSAGRDLYFQEQTDNHARFVMTKASLYGGPPESLRLPLENPDPGVIARDSSAMLLRSVQGSKDGDEPLFLQPLPAGSPIRLGDIRAYDSAWSPDGKFIVFSRQRTVYLATREGKVLRKLFDLPGRAYRFRWSPRNASLRFTVYDSGLSSYSIWQADSLTSVPYQLDLGLAHLPQQCCGEWSPEGRTFFFQAMVDGFYQVFAHDESPAWLRAGRAPSVQLTSGPMHYRSPIPTSDGSALLLLTQSQKSELVYYDRTGHGWLPFLDGVPVAAAAVSPDGRLLAYTRPPDHTLWRCRLPACSDPVQLTFPPLRVTMPRWAPDSSTIACMVRQLGQPWRAAILPASGGSLKNLLPGRGEEADPDYSPRGDRLVIGMPPTPDPGEDVFLRIVDLQTRSAYPVPGSKGYNTPRWSPDGRFLAAVRSSTLEPALYEFATGRWSPLPGGRVGYLNWSSDASTLYLLSGVGSREPQILAIDPHRRTARAVASLSGVRKPAFSFGDWVGLGPGNILLALRDLSSEEILCWPLAPAPGFAPGLLAAHRASSCPSPGR